MSIPSWFWSALGGVLVVAAIMGGGAALNPHTDSGKETIGGEARKAPNFTLQTLEGDRFRLRDHRGTVVVLNFWATWCPPCRREIPTFVKLQRELGDQGLQFVGVALERSAGPKEVRAFAEKMDINYPIGLGNGTIAQKYGGVRGLPRTFVIGPDGKIRGRITGMATESMLRPGLEELLKEAS